MPFWPVEFWQAGHQASVEAQPTHFITRRRTYGRRLLDLGVGHHSATSPHSSHSLTFTHDMRTNRTYRRASSHGSSTLGHVTTVDKKSPLAANCENDIILPFDAGKLPISRHRKRSQSIREPINVRAHFSGRTCALVNRGRSTRFSHRYGSNARGKPAHAAKNPGVASLQST